MFNHRIVCGPALKHKGSVLSPRNKIQQPLSMTEQIPRSDGAITLKLKITRTSLWALGL